MAIPSNHVSRSGRLRHRLAAALLQGHFFLSPSVVPPWRLGITPPPAAVLAVGAPVRRVP